MTLVETSDALKLTMPDTWRGAEQRIEQRLSKLPKVRDDFPMPFSTYILKALVTHGLTYRLLNVNAFLSEQYISDFINSYSKMRDVANIQAELDKRNFQDEIMTRQEIVPALKAPQLDISEIYRYAVAVHLSMLTYIPDDVKATAVYKLRLNPFLYIAYGDQFEAYMPVRIEGL